MVAPGEKKWCQSSPQDQSLHPHQEQWVTPDSSICCLINFNLASSQTVGVITFLGAGIGFRGTRIGSPIVCPGVSKSSSSTIFPSDSGFVWLGVVSQTQSCKVILG